MTKNMGTLDRTIRTLGVIVIAGLYFTHTIGGVLALVLGILAAASLISSLVGFCPAYALLGWSTCGKKAPGSAGA